MKHHGYVRNLKATAEQFGCKVVDYRMLDFFGNDLNPSGVICIVKSEVLNYKPTTWRCPLTHASLDRGHNAFHSPETGIVYPLLDGILCFAVTMQCLHQDMDNRFHYEILRKLSSARYTAKFSFH